MTPKQKTPAELGFRMPAEWEPREATWLAWPYNLKTWGSHLEGAEAAMAEYIKVLAKHERIDLLVAHEGVEQRARKLLDPLGLRDDQLRYHQVESGDVWIRDYGPIFVVSDKGGKHEVAWTKWTYNALGMPEEYADLLPGDAVPDALPLKGMKKFDGKMVLEGGSIDVNGTGTLLTTESCLLSDTRNPDMTKEQIEKRLHDYLGVTNVLWLSAGIEGDDTSGHIDDLTRFVGQSTVVTVVETDPKDENYATLQENSARLRGMKDEKGTPLTVIEMPMPKPFIVDGRRMAASYANFYIGAKSVLVPVYSQPSDAVALKILKGCFPDRNVVGIDCREFIWGYGSIHCSSQQQPA
ncbi:MAG TPA: agmatine deiminase family protein [Candidatus Peribacteria bacterium]|nr:agmatine deiminase family protein [Candidatus Peribacteria bacterium]